MRRAVTLTVALVVLTLALAGCNGDSRGAAHTDRPDVSADAVTVETPVGSIERPRDWQAAEGPLHRDLAARFTRSRGGEVVAQLDVFVNSVPAGSPADAITAQKTGARMPFVTDLRTESGEFVDVAGADSAYVQFNTYTTADGGPARSVDQIAIAPSGDYLLVRFSAVESAFDRRLFSELLATMRLKTGVDT